MTCEEMAPRKTTIRKNEDAWWHVAWPCGWLIIAYPSFAEAVRAYREAEMEITLNDIERSA